MPRYNIGGETVEASSLSEAMEIANRIKQLRARQAADTGAGGFLGEDDGPLGFASAAGSTFAGRPGRAEPSGTIGTGGFQGEDPGTFSGVGGAIDVPRTPFLDQGLAKVPAGDQPWLRDPRIMKPPPGGWPHAERFGMDVADLARRAGVSEGEADNVIRYMMEGNLPPAYYTLGLEDDDPNYINLGGGYGRKTPEEWNRPSGQVWTDPQMMRMYRMLAEDPSRLAGNPRSSFPAPTGDAATRLYRTLAGMPAVEPTPQRTGGRTDMLDPETGLPIVEYMPDTPGSAQEGGKKDDKADDWFEPDAGTGNGPAPAPPATLATPAPPAARTGEPAPGFAPAPAPGDYQGQTGADTWWRELGQTPGIGSQQGMAEKLGYRRFLDAILPEDASSAYRRNMETLGLPRAQRAFGLASAVTPGVSEFGPFLANLNEGVDPTRVSQQGMGVLSDLLRLGETGRGKLDPTTLGRVPGMEGVTGPQWDRMMGGVERFEADPWSQFNLAMQPELRTMDPNLRSSYDRVMRRKFENLMEEGGEEGFNLLPYMQERGWSMFGAPQQQITPPGGLNYGTIGGVNIPFLSALGPSGQRRATDFGGDIGTQANEQIMRKRVQDEPWSLPGDPKLIDWQTTQGMPQQFWD